MPAATKHAAIIGIDAYGSGIACLKSAVADARAIAAALERDHGYGSPHLLLDGEASGAAILRLLEETLPAAVDGEAGVVLYYAGHGVALGDGSEGPEGFLLPQDARPGDQSTWLPMERVRKALSRLPCKHLLVVLDCCFAGSFRWAASRSFVPVGRPLYDSQYARFLAGTAWQALTSASHQETAQDVIPGSRNTRDGEAKNGHSPFAAALLKGLAGEADSSRGGHESDGVITATELHQYIFEELVPPGSRSRQTPGIWPLKSENTGEFLFLAPGRERKTQPDPPLDDANNPWLGLQAYGCKDAPLFFGRERVVEEILDRLLDPARSPFLAVVGASGTGKSSVVRAGVLPRLENPPEERAAKIGAWTVARLPRLQGDPRPQLEEALGTLAAVPADRRKLLFIDQFEELYTQCHDGEIRDDFLRRLRELVTGDDPLKVVITVRSDFEPRLASSAALGEMLAGARYLVRAMTSEEYRDVIEEPAKLKALYCEPAALVGELVDEVMAMPGGLPLLSFALSEMYRQAQLRRRSTGALDRALTRDDCKAAGGVVGALHRRANELYEAADPARQETIRRLFLRMVAQEGGRLARRRVEDRELEFADAEEQVRVRRVLDDYIAARLLVADEGYVEPAHDTLILAWDRLLDWLAASGSQELVRQLWGAASAWEAASRDGSEKKASGLLWNQDPRLPLVQDRYLGSSGSWLARLRTRGPVRTPAHAGELNGLERRFAERSVARKRSRRNLVAGITAAVILALSGATWYSLDRAEQERQAKVKAQDIARVSVAGEWLEKDPTRAALVLLEVTEPNETAYAVQRMRDALAGPLSEAVLRHQDEVKSAAFSHDGKRIVTVSGNEVSGNLRTWVWTADGSGGFVAREGPKGLESSADFSPHGSHIVIASGDGTARVWAADGSGKRVGEPVAVIADPKYMVWEAAISPDGTRVFTRDGGNVARLWAIDRNPVEVIDGPTSFASKAAFSPDGTRLVTVSDGAEVWAIDDFDEPIKLLGHKDSVWSAAFSPDGTRVVTASEDGTARVWKVDGYEPVVLGDDVIELSSDGAHVLTGSEDGTVRLGSADGSREKKPVVLGGNEMSGAAFSPDGKHVLITSEDGTVRLGPADGSRKPVILRGYQGPVESAAFSPDGKHVLTTSKDGTVRLGPADGSGRPVILLGHQDPLAFSADGRLVIASEDKTVRVWTADGSGEAVVLRDHDNEVTSAAFSPDGKRVVTVSDDKTARVWAADGSGKPVVLGGHEYSVSDAVFSPDGKHVLTTSEDGSQRLGPADGSRKPAVLGLLMSVEFSADGKRVLTVSFDGTVRVGAADDLGNPRALITLTNLGAFGSASFSPDGKYVLTHPGTIPGSDYQQMQVMAADGTGEPILSIDYAEDVAFSSDGTRVVTKFKSQDDTVTVKVYAIGGRLLQALIRAATATCLEPEFRFRFLGETRAVARETSKRCQRCVKTRQSDIRSVRAAPEQAWAKWQQCMGR